MSLNRKSLLYLGLAFFSVVTPGFSEAQPATQAGPNWSPLDLLRGPAAMAGGAMAPIACTIRYTLIPFELVYKQEPGPGSSQAGIAIPFLPFIAATGAIGGTIRGGMLFATGVADSVTGGAYKFSGPAWGEEIYSSDAWCLGARTPAGQKKTW